MDTLTEHPHVVRDTAILGGEPIITGTRTPVRAVVEMWRTGLSPDEIIARLPHIRLAQVFDALGFFEDHAAEILQYIEKNKIDEHLLNAANSKGASK
jgi:uncharacterized protein (DUF433 family)